MLDLSGGGGIKCALGTAIAWRLANISLGMCLGGSGGCGAGRLGANHPHQILARIWQSGSCCLLSCTQGGAGTLGWVPVAAGFSIVDVRTFD